MNNRFSWKNEDIQNTNNFLIIRGYKFCTSTVDPEYVNRACYALPSSPDKMDDWVYRHLTHTQAQELYNFILQKRQSS